MGRQAAKFRISRPPPKLAGMVNRPGGLLRDAAIAHGQRALEQHRASARERLSGLIEVLDADTRAPGLPGDGCELQRTTDRVIELAALFELAELEDAGKSLSELLSLFRATGRPHAGAIAVHVQAMRLLAGAAAPSEMAGVMEKLGRVRAHFGAGAPKKP